MSDGLSTLKRYLPIIVLGALLLLPLGLEQYKLFVASLVLIYVIAAIGLNLTLGYAGQISLAHAAFLAFGAYSVGILQPLGLPFELCIIVGAAISFCFGLCIGFPALRVKHHYLAMVTLGFTIIVFLCLRNFEGLTGGSFGIAKIARPDWGIVSFDTDRAFYIYTLIWAVPVLASAYWIKNSRWGRAFKSIRENEMRAQALGVSLRNYKLMAFAIGAGYAGIAGGLFAPLLSYIDPPAFYIERTILFLMIVVIGGLGRFEGPIIGSIIVVVLPELLRVSEGFYLIIFSLSIILMMLFMPRGLIGLWDLFIERFVIRPPASEGPETRKPDSGVDHAAS